MECFCGCGIKVNRRQVALNLQVAETALELLVWDKARSAGYLGAPPSAELENLIEDGAVTYRRMLAALHGENGGLAEEEGERWLEQARAARRDREHMTERGSILKPSKARVTDEDRAHLDRLHPERSFSARSVPHPIDDGASGRLERLEALHREGVLTDEEFRAARERL